MKADHVSIIIPVLNEEVSVATVVESLISKFPAAEIIVVDDGSNDNTAQLAKETGAIVLSHERTRGYGAALKTGIEASSRGYMLFCDGDGQHSVDDAARLMEACDNVDMVIGRRNHESHVSFARRPGKFILRKFANVLAGQKVPDFNSGLRIVRKEILLRYIHLMPNGFSFSTTTTFSFLKTNRRIKYVPITTQKRIGASSVRQWKHGPQTLMLMLRLTVLFEPLKVFLSAAGVLFVLSLVTLLLDIINSDTFEIGDATVMLSVSTLLVFMFGLLCDQVSAIRRESHE